MKFSIPPDQFLSQLGIAVRGVSTRSAIQTLAGVLIRAENGAVELQATDMELGIRVRVDTAPERDGAVVLPGRLLLDVVRSLPQDQLSLEYRASEQDVELVSGPAKFHLRTLPLDDFPKLPEAGDAGTMHVPAGAFVETIGRVARSASRDETRPVLTGILVSASGQELRMVATDSYRLSVKRTQLEAPLEGSFEANVPARALQELVRLAQQAPTDRLAVGVGANQVVVEADGAVLSSRLIDGQFPNFQQLLPDAFEHELRVAGDELTEVVRRISLLAQKNAPLRLAFAEGEVTVSAQTP